MKKFDEILDFAIAREQDAVDFYVDLQKKANFSAQEEMLEELAEMERGHKKMLMKIKENGVVSEQVKKVEDLHISDYVVEIEPSDEMDYQDILTIAMKREEAAFNLYTNMANAISNADLKHLFTKLAAEEAGHKNRFEKLYDEEILKEN